MGYYADALVATADVLGVDRFNVYGAHTGAHIAIEAAIRYPDRIDKIILDGVAILSKQERAEYLKYYAPPRQPDAEGSQFPWAWNYIRDQMIFYPHYRKDSEHLRVGGSLDPAVLHRLSLELLKNIDSYHMAYNAVFNHDVCSRAPLVDRPALVLAGVAGPLDQSAGEIAALIPKATLARTVDESAADTLAGKSQLINEFLLGS